MNDPYYNNQNYHYPPPPMNNQQQNYYQPNNGDPYAQQHASQQKPSDEEKFKESPKFQDLWAAIFYFITLGIFLVFSVFMIKGFKISQFNNQEILKVNYAFIIAPIISVIISLLLSIGYLFFMVVMPSFLIKFSIISNIVLAIISGFWLLSGKYYTSYKSTVFSTLVGIVAYIYFCCLIWHRIPFTSLMLKTVSQFTRKYPGTIVFGICTAILNMLWVLYWICTVVASYKKFSTCTNSGTDQEKCKMKISFVGIILFSSFILYWTFQLLKDITYTTIAGSFASDYFSPKGGRLTTLKAFKRTATTSFGSVCFGSLLVGIITFLKSLLSQASRNSDSAALQFLCCCCSCILAQIEYLVQHFNAYAYTYVAIYGTGYIESGKNTFNLIKNRGIDAIANEILVGEVLTTGSTLISMVSALVAFIFMTFSTDTSNQNHILWCTCLAFVLALIFSFVVFRVIESANTSFFVCLAEDPQALEQHNPALYNKIREAYPVVTNAI